ncbi:TIR domain-containing protein [Adhaeribacter rhizoryzae]|uniref:TIR-like domain-containing protein n=1 Tax=Adhaeribacter rhizoryzae TaxID=2607907 RepID=A0A5M6CV89_9BACT|nr:TIR domain-containing protein [Adhaeribacter rhizoryzae]KAA5538856.1 TIR-like domain-containing protein [Adhaeribacter rhizoryzae]
MAVKKVFVSYDHSENVHYKDLLRAWDANTDFDFEFDQRSPNVPIESTASSVIQGALTKKMKEADYILVIIGEKSYSSKWMKWEIDRAKQPDTNLRFAAVKIKSGNINPAGLPRYTAIANSFTLSGIVYALNNAIMCY